MLKFRHIAQIVVLLVDSMLKNFSDKNTLLVIKVRMTLRKKSRDGKSVSRWAVMAFHRPDAYTKFLWGEGEMTLTPHEWTVKCDSDGIEWRTKLHSAIYELSQDLRTAIRVQPGDELEESVLFESPGVRLLKLNDFEYDPNLNTFNVFYAYAGDLKVEVEPV